MSSFNALREPKNGPAVIISRANQIHFNLALELYILDIVKPQVPLFLWWRNDRNVVIGRYQNPYKECNLHKMATDGVDLARRFTGGGAVYQDLGNSVFSFLTPLRCFDVHTDNHMLLSVLKDKFGIQGKESGRNDLFVGEQKFSGAAFKIIKDASGEDGIGLHHGTLLLSTDLSAMSSYLTPTKSKFKSTGVPSAKSKIINLSELNPEISHEALEQPLIEKFFQLYDTDGIPRESRLIMVIDQNHQVKQNFDFQRYHNLLTDWTWRYGATPVFTYTLENKFDWGYVELNIDVRNGIMRDVKLFTDMLHDDLVPKIEAALKNNKYEVKAISEAFESTAQSLQKAKTSSSFQDYQKILDELAKWITQEMTES